jgi:hypothetical protein
VVPQRDPESPKTHSTESENCAPLTSPSPVRSKKPPSMSISEEGASLDFGNLSIITGQQQTPKKTPVPKERTIAQPAFDVEELVAKLVGVISLSPELYVAVYTLSISFQPSVLLPL